MKYDRYKFISRDSITARKILSLFRTSYNRRRVKEQLEAGNFRLYGYSNFVNTNKTFDGPHYKIWIPLVRYANSYRCIKIDTGGITSEDMNLDCTKAREYYPVKEIQVWELYPWAQEVLNEIVSKISNTDLLDEECVP